MGVKIERRKPRILIISLLYRLIKLPLSNSGKLKLFLNLEWIFDRLAHELSFKIYSSETHPIRICAKNFLWRFITEQQNVLDLGCSTGDITNIVAEKAKTVVGIDHNENSIKTAREKYQRDNLTFICDDARNYLHENPKKFDLLILSHILEHLDNPKDFLLNFKNYFEYIYIEVPDFDKTPLNHYRQNLEMKLIYTDDDHVSEFDRNELKKLFDECGVKIIESEYIFGVQRYWCKV